ncbi:30S ribosomal protein S18 [Candidatus Dojkabacteria bacterium]|uniref:Small ribosomal subunit protein bS18 n=1 Tax=Candidatus Dojkabacteria bacterium TaxID=2099670 RepID=A0A955ICV1_9BACT|nr:30S ribosomal protein S18 [Candidatus Dojkabacteria bacterium]
MANTKKYKAPVVASCPLKGREDQITYKNVSLLEKFISTRGRIMPSSRTGVCASNQRKLALAVKRARHMALLPYTKYV